MNSEISALQYANQILINQCKAQDEMIKALKDDLKYEKARTDVERKKYGKMLEALTEIHSIAGEQAEYYCM